MVTTSYNYESISLDAMKRWLSGIRKEVHVLGPLLPPGYGIETQKTEEGASVDIETFLGEMLAQHGKRSVFFVRFFSFPLSLSVPNNFYYQISFGTIHWTAAPEHVDELIDALIEKKAPFVRAAAIVYDSGSLFNQILASASSRAKISEQQTEKIKSSGLGLLTTWSPQQFILNHPV